MNVLAKLSGKLLDLFLVLVLAASAAVAINRVLISTHNTDATHFDTLIVLGYPTNPDGTPSPEQRARVLEAVREYKAGVAPYIIFTGAAAHNQFVESNMMAGIALVNGVPASAILPEFHAQNTIQNIFYSAGIMRSHNWHSAEVISTPEHLPRAAMILAAYDKKHPMSAIEWRTHSAPWPAEYSFSKRLSLDVFEDMRCLEIRLFGLPKSRFL